MTADEAYWVQDTDESLAVRGELDIATTLRLLDDVRRAARRRGPIQLDLSGVSFMDSAGLRALERLHEAHDVTVIAASPAVRRIAALLGRHQLVA